MQNKDPLIVIVCEDLFFLPRIQDAAIALGYRYEAIAKKKTSVFLILWSVVRSH